MTQRPIEQVLEATLNDLQGASSHVGHAVYSDASTCGGDPLASISRRTPRARRSTVHARRRLASDMQSLVEVSMDWLIRVESTNCTSQVRLDFEQWLHADVTHLVAVTMATRTRDRINRLRNLRPVNGNVDPDLLLSPASIPRPIGRPSTVVPPAQRDAPLRALAAGIVGLTLLGAGVTQHMNNQVSSGVATHIANKQALLLAVGERQGRTPTPLEQPKLCGATDGLLRACDDEG